MIKVIYFSVSKMYDFSFIIFVLKWAQANEIFCIEPKQRITDTLKDISDRKLITDIDDIYFLLDRTKLRGNVLNTYEELMIFNGDKLIFKGYVILKN